MSNPPITPGDTRIRLGRELSPVSSQTRTRSTMVCMGEDPGGPSPTTPEGGLSLKAKIDLNRGLNFDRLAVLFVRTIFPLLHGVDGGRREHRMAADKLHVAHAPGFVDDYVENNGSLNARLTSERRK